MTSPPPKSQTQEPPHDQPQDPFADKISSRPRYAPLGPRPCLHALMIADSAGAAALIALADTAPDLMAKAIVLLVQDGATQTDTAPTAPPPPGLPTATTRITREDLDTAIDAALSGTGMGLQAFLAGSEGLIAQAQARLLAAGLPLGAIQSEHRGTAARRMQCVHCKTIAEGVTTDPYRCPGCGRALYVRDHFSRRLGAFQGVCIDAETPGEVPEPTEIHL